MGYLMSKRFVMPVTAALAIALATAFAPAAGAAKKTCAKRGYAAEIKTYENFLMRKSVRDKSEWSGTAGDYYVCSRKHRVRVGIGTYGVSWDGEVAYESLTMSSDYAALFTGTGNNAGSPEFLRLNIHNLRTRKKRSINLETQASGNGATATAISALGDFAWIVPGTEGGMPVNVVYLAGRASGPTIRTVAKGAQIDPSFLKFSYVEGKPVVIWSTTSANFTVE